jgi:hypothetical protein
VPQEREGGVGKVRACVFPFAVSARASLLRASTCIPRLTHILPHALPVCELCPAQPQPFIIMQRQAGGMGAARPQVSESAFSYLHMELVQMVLGPQPAGSGHTTSQLQHASRKIEAVGFQVGVRLVERYTRDRPRFNDTLEIIKFICKDFWMEVYRKHVDKLQTNNKVRARPLQVGVTEGSRSLARSPNGSSHLLAAN